ncbi:MAG: FAD-dependent oxidoreductase [Saprospiraceae bacterium]|nr:FAD-dependent oxidoreductase [Saprospiraceae bacterium]
MNSLSIKGQVFNKTDEGFDKAILATLFNKLEPNRRPEMMVVPETVDDIIDTVRYAKAQGRKLSVCSGGHSWSANHLRNGSILINMKRFNKYEVNKEAMTATAGPAVGGSVLLTELVKHDLFFPAGHCKGVCIGGYLLQGGFAWNGRKLGMACESVMGLDIVTADGELIHASATENADLYWAARGSGGGFFGVVVRFHLRLYKLPPYRGMVSHVFTMKHLEHVFRWAYEVGPSVPKAVEFQMLMSRHTLNYFAPGIEAVAPIFADSKDELNEAMAFMKNSPIKRKAYFRTPYVPFSMETMYNFAMSHYPDDHHWGVDNMWTGASIDDLMPFLRDIAATLPPPPTHLLWLNWQPPVRTTEMAFSMEDKIYIALYGAWKSSKDTPQYGNWATNHIKRMEHLCTGIQLADEGLHKRPARFVSDAHLQKLDEIRAKRDGLGVFNEWHSRPQV